MELPIHVSRPRRNAHKPPSDVTWHHPRLLPDHHILVVNGLRVTTPARMIAEWCERGRRGSVWLREYVDSKPPNDAQRDEVMEAAGFAIIRFKESEVWYDGANVVRRWRAKRDEVRRGT